jgi:hypothetical protein
MVIGVMGNNFFSMETIVVQYTNRDGTVMKMDLVRSRNGHPMGWWEPMYHSWGFGWTYNTSDALIGVLQVRTVGKGYAIYNIPLTYKLEKRKDHGHGIDESPRLFLY